MIGESNDNLANEVDGEGANVSCGEVVRAITIGIEVGLGSDGGNVEGGGEACSADRTGYWTGGRDASGAGVGEFTKDTVKSIDDMVVGSSDAGIGGGGISIGTGCGHGCGHGSCISRGWMPETDSVST